MLKDQVARYIMKHYSATLCKNNINNIKYVNLINQNEWHTLTSATANQYNITHLLFDPGLFVIQFQLFASLLTAAAAAAPRLRTRTGTSQVQCSL